MMLLALDPGTNSPGIAVFHDGVLIHAARVKLPAMWADLPDGQRWLNIGFAIADAVSGGIIDQVAFERPQWYARGKSKGDPNQLAGLTGVSGVVLGLLSPRAPLMTVASPKPAEWIGQISKTCPKCKANKKSCATCQGSAWLTPRGRFIRPRLTPQEQALCPDQNDAIDAVGIGLHVLGRLKPRKVYSNGRDGR